MAGQSAAFAVAAAASDAADKRRRRAPLTLELARGGDG